MECSEEVPSYLRFASSIQSQPSLKVLNYESFQLQLFWGLGEEPVLRPVYPGRRQYSEVTYCQALLSGQCHQGHSPCVTLFCPKVQEVWGRGGNGRKTWMESLIGSYGNALRHAEDMEHTGFNSLWGSRLLPRVKGHTSKGTELFRCHSNPHLSIFLIDAQNYITKATIKFRINLIHPPPKGISNLLAHICFLLPILSPW